MAAQRENISTNEANTEEGKQRNETEFSNNIIHMPGTNHEEGCTNSWTCQLCKQKVLSYISIIATDLCIVLNIFCKALLYRLEEITGTSMKLFGF